MGALVENVPDVPEQKSEARIRLANKKEVPKGFENLGIGKEITLKVTGKISHANKDDWAGGSVGLEVEISDIAIESDDTQVTMSSAIDKAKKTV